MENKDYNFWVDGACSGNPGPGGYGVVIFETFGLSDETVLKYPKYVDCFTEKSENTTNNREELKAIIYAMRFAKEHPDSTIICYSDSAYAVNSVNNWIRGWAQNGWKNSKKKEVENIDLMKTIYELLDAVSFNFELYKVSGHINILGNEMADALASGNDAKFQKLYNEAKNI